MDDALIGYTGFVGSNLLSQHKFTYLYDIENINSIVGKEFDLVVCAAAPGRKWYANQNAEEDLNSIKLLIENIKKIYTNKFVLISTIDVYPYVYKVNEDSFIDKAKLQPYGKHRRILEEYVQTHFDSLVIRLPGIFGKGLNGNIIYDLIHKKYNFIPQDGMYQFYCLNHLWKDIQKALINDIEVLNISTEPILLEELLKGIFNIELSSKSKIDQKPYYDMHTKYGYLWGMNNHYIYSKNEVLSEIEQYINENYNN